MSHSRIVSLARVIRLWLVILAFGMLSTACGGGGGDDGGGTNNPPAAPPTNNPKNPDNPDNPNNPGGITPDTQPPSVSLDVDNVAVTEAGAVTLTATASDDSGIEKVDFIENDVVIETVREAPFVSLRTYTISDNGSKSIIVKAYDKAGNISSSTVIIIIVNITVAPPADNSPPSVSLNVPQTAVTNAGDFMVTANATDNVGIAKVEIYRGDTLVCTDTTSAYQYRDKLTAADNGSITYTAKAYDAAGNVTTSEPVTVVINIPAPTWSIADLGTLGGSYSFAYAINDAGEVVGLSFTGEKQPNSANYVTHAFLYKNGKMIDLGTLNGGLHSEARAINNAGQIVGQSFTADAGPLGFFYQDGQMTVLGPNVDGAIGEANAINDAGEIGGLFRRAGADGFTYNHIASDGSMSYLFGSTTAEGSRTITITGINNAGQMIGNGYTYAATRAYLNDNGTVTDLGLLDRPSYTGPHETEAIAINNQGQIVGVSKKSAFLYSNGMMTDLGAILGAASSVATGINDSGQIVGYMAPPSSQTVHAFLYSNGNLINLNELPEIKTAGWSIYRARGINNSGQIIAEGTNNNGITRAVLLTPPK